MKNTRDVAAWFITFEDLAIREGLYTGHIDHTTRAVGKKLFNHGYNAGAAVAKLKLEQEKLSAQTGEKVEGLQNRINGPLKVQELEVSHNGYEGWNTYAVRTKENYCLAVVGEVDRATSSIAKQAAYLFAAAPELLKVLTSLTNLIDKDSDGSYFICEEGSADVRAAFDLLTKLNEVTK